MIELIVFGVVVAAVWYWRKPIITWAKETFGRD